MYLRKKNLTESQLLQILQQFRWKGLEESKEKSNITIWT